MKDRLLRQLEEYIPHDPAFLGDLFKLVSDNWNKMIEAQRSERESTHLFALSEMINNLWAFALYRKRNPRLWSNVECCTILDAVDAVMPKATASSNPQRTVLAHLAKSCRALGWKPNSDFIRDIRNKEEFLQNLYLNYPSPKPSKVQ